jgi:hypothetical protein
MTVRCRDREFEFTVPDKSLATLTFALTEPPR